MRHEQLPFQRRRRLRVLPERRRRHSQPRHGHAARLRDFGMLVMIDRHSCNPTIRGRYHRGAITATSSTLLCRTPAFSAHTILEIMLLAGHAPVQRRIDDDLFDVCRQTKFPCSDRYQLELQQGIDERHPIACPGDPASGPCNKRSENSFHLIFWVMNGIRYVAVHVPCIYFSEPLSPLFSSCIVRKYSLGPRLYSFVLVYSARKTHSGLWTFGLFDPLNSLNVRKAKRTTHTSSAKQSKSIIPETPKICCFLNSELFRFHDIFPL